MFVGHFGAGLALKRVAPRVSLGTLFLASLFLDLLWPTLLLLGIERVEIAPAENGPPLRFTHYPYSHSLAFVVLWASLFSAAHFGFNRRRLDALVCGIAVLSHWLLDTIVHHPDLPLAPGPGPQVGFGLWQFPVTALLLELAVFAAGCGWYVRSTTARDRIGQLGLAGLIAFLLALHVANLLGPPPPSVAAVAWVGQAQWLLILWGYWVDRHREAKRA